MFTSSHQMLQCPPRSLVDRKWNSNVESAPNCPRCASSNTKFCYYNNYSLSQPRYFCKGCRRYWTKGGSLRNVPVGGGCRRNRRGKSVKVHPTTTEPPVPVPVTSSSPPNEPFVNSNGEDSIMVQSDIDLAVVFAKFFNQNSSSDEAEFVGPELPNEANNNVQQEEIMIEYEKPFMGEAELLEGLPDHDQQEFVGEKKQQSEEIFMGNNDSNVLASLQSLLDGDNNQVVQEALWSDDASSSNLQNFPWQPMLQFQEFESINLPSHDHIDQFRISTFPISDNNWSSFDMSGLEVFLRP